MDHREVRKSYFGKLGDRALEPDDELYVPLYDENHDHILLMKEAIEFSIGAQSVQLLSGYRGAGKSTQLKRLRNLLQQEGYFVALIDIEDYLDLNTPMDVTDFLLALCGALGEEMEKDGMLGKNTGVESPWGRFSNWFGSKVEFTELSTEAPAGITTAALKAELRTNPTFRQQVQETLAGSLRVFNAKVREFVAENVTALNEKRARANQPHAPLVILVDSIEHARGTRATEADVHSSLERLFAQHDDKLKLPYVHLVYTVPPWLRIRYNGIGGLYDGLYTLPEIQAHHYPVPDKTTPRPHDPGLALLREVVEKRVDPDVLFATAEDLDHLMMVSGGHLRDLIRLLRAVVLQSRALPATSDNVNAAIQRIRAEFLPIANQDALWLAQIARTHTASLETNALVGDLARFFDTHLVLCYFDGEEWYDVHPLVRDIVLEQARTYEETAPDPPTPS